MARSDLFLVVALVALCGDFMSNASDVNEACENQTLCDIVPEEYKKYQEDIDNKFEEITKKFNLPSSMPTSDDSLEPTVNESPNNCRSVTQVYKPYTVKTNNGTKYVVQSKFYEQKFKTTRCASMEKDFPTDGDQCFHGLTGSTKGTCTTKETVIVLYVYNKDTTRIERIRASFPSCCVCDIN